MIVVRVDHAPYKNEYHTEQHRHQHLDQRLHFVPPLQQAVLPHQQSELVPIVGHAMAVVGVIDWRRRVRAHVGAVLVYDGNGRPVYI